MSINSLTTHILVPPSDSATTATFSFPASLPIRAGNSVAADLNQQRSLNGRALRLQLAGSVPRKTCRKCPQAAADDTSSSDVSQNGASAATVEQGKRILAMQKELLEQIAERKKLVTSLKENLGNASEKVKTYNDANGVKARKPISSQKEFDENPTSLEKSTKQNSVSAAEQNNGSAAKGNNGSSAKQNNGSAAKGNNGSAAKQNNGSATRTSISYSPTQTTESLNQSKVLNNKKTATQPIAKPLIFEMAPTSSRVANMPASVKEPPRKEELARKPAEENLIPQPRFREPEITRASDSKANEKEGHDVDSANATEEPAAPLAGPNVMNVIVVAAECAPWSKTGGLGDVAGALPKALARRGHRVMVVAPRYGNYGEAFDVGVRKRYNVAGQDMEIGYFHAYIDGVDHVFIDHNEFHGYANNIYGGKGEDVLKRMVLFCKAAVEVPWHVPCGGICYGDGNLVFIANDWHTALLPVYLQAYYRDNGLMQFTRSILVIHNMAHQGRGPMAGFPVLGLPDHYRDKFNLYDPIGGEHMNVLMAGLISAHRIVAVSHGYAWECQTQEGGWGLDGIMREHNWKLRGIVNGIDDKEWSPEFDAHLKSDGYTNYSVDTLDTGKATCKAALQKELGLPVRSDVPLLGFIGRLDHQKGVDIIAEAMPWITQQDVQLVMLGTGRDDLEEMLRSFEGQYRDKVRAWVGFSVKTAHRITAGCDLLLMPSRFEPCGLNQLYAMKYGTIPVVHAVGGLRDTVQTFDPFNNTGTGWTFSKADAGELIHALGNALWTYRDYKDSWRGIQLRGMTQDLSWDNAAKQYEEVLVAAKYQW